MCYGYTICQLHTFDYILAIYRDIHICKIIIYCIYIYIYTIYKYFTNMYILIYTLNIHEKIIEIEL